MPRASGNVVLVGAGPGDPGLLTLRGARALRDADVLLYDALASDAILALASPTCERVFVGKRGGDHAMPQIEIEALMVREARAGKRVVRLKGGDPFVFGRGGEEAQTLRRAGIAFEIVPGISSAIAAPAYAGIPVTHREHNTAFTVATGHEDPTKPESTLDWQRLADPHRTLVLLMAMGNLDAIVARLLEHGMPGETPAALIENGTRPEQRTVTGTLASIVADATRARIAGPSIFVVGSVVGLRDEIAWFDTSRLFGKRVLVTRPAAQAPAFAEAIAMRGAAPIVAPTIIVGPPDDATPLDAALGALSRYAWVAFTSRNGVDACFARLDGIGRDARAFSGVKVAAIGPKTAEALGARGIRADLVPPVFVAEAVASALLGVTQSGDRVLVLRAQEARDVLPQALRAAGRVVDAAAAYKTSFVSDAQFPEKVARADVLTFASASSIAGFARNLGGKSAATKASRGKVVACIGPVTADAARETGLHVDVVAESFTADGLVNALEEYFASRTH